MRTGLWLGIATAGIAFAAAACGLSSADSAFGGAQSKADDPNGSPSGDFADSGTAPNAALDQNGVLLVHAANAPAFRLCFEDDLTLKPQPDATLMPAANVVGVEVGSAVRIDPVRHVVVPDATISHRIFHFSEEDIRVIYGPAGQNLTCEQLLSSKTLSKFSTELKGFDGDLSYGLHILALTGCEADTPIIKHTKAECGDTYDGTSTLAIQHISLTGRERIGSKSALPAQVVNLSSVLDKSHGASSIEVQYGDLVATDSGTPLETVISAPQYAALEPATGPKDLTLPTDAAGYDTKGFRISLKDNIGTMTTVSDQSLATINRLSSPRDLPTDYYQAASSYLFLVLGAPAPAYTDGGGVDPDELKNIHILAVPVIEPKTPDAGSDASTNP